ncbi:GMC oxidoreductase [Methylobacterium sp. CM6257]
MPLAESDFGARSHLGMAGWPLQRADLDRFLVEVEQLLDLDHTSYEQEPSDLVASTNADSGLVGRWIKFPDLCRRNFAYLFHDLLLRTEKIDLWLDATAAGFTCDPISGRVVAVQTTCAAGRGLIVEAEEFIIACGTLETTRLLLLLDRSTNERAFSDCGALGRYFHDHLIAEIGRGVTANAQLFRLHIQHRTRRRLRLETTFSSQLADRAASGYVSASYVFPANHWAPHARRLAIGGHSRVLSSVKALRNRFEQVCPSLYWSCHSAAMERSKGVELALEARIEQVPDRACRLSLSGRADDFGIPILQMHWQKGRTEERTFQAVLKRAKAFWKVHKLDSTMPVRWAAEIDEKQGRPLCEMSDDACHPAGTARMGLRSSASVVGPDLRCHAVSNLLVASAAVFPSSGSANPTLTIMQLAMLAAESVLRAKY